MLDEEKSHSFCGEHKLYLIKDCIMGKNKIEK